MKKTLLALLASLLAVAAVAQTPGQETRALLLGYDVASVSPTLIYCSYSDSATATVDPLGRGNQNQGTAKTVGSSTTVTSKVASSGAFTSLAAGDKLTFNVGGRMTERYITTWTNADSIVVNLAIDLSGDSRGYTFWHKHLYCGTGAGDGWWPVNGASLYTITSTIGTINATSITTAVECKLDGQTGVTIDTNTRTAVGTAALNVNGAVFDWCRFGLSLAGDGGAQSVSGAVSIRYGVGN